MEDIYPVLKEKINKQFDKRISSNKDIQSILKNKYKNKTLADVSYLANTIGEYAALSLINVLTEDNLPDGKLYFNILDRAVNDIMHRVYDVVNKMFGIVQSNIDKKNKIGMKVSYGKYNAERIMEIINKISSVESEIEDEE